MRSLLTPLALALGLLTTPALADLEDMSEAERTAFRAEVRAYLLDNPEVLMEAIGVLEQRAAEEEAARDQELVSAYQDELFNGGHWVGGNPDGDITLVEFMDYRCSYCRRAFGEVAELLSTDGNIRFIVVEYPILGEQSVLAARYALAVRELAGDAAYEEAHDALMLMRADVSEDSLRGISEDLELEFEEIAALMSSDDVTQIIAENRELGAALEISGTPSFVMNDTMLRGYLPFEQMAAIAQSIRSADN